MNSKSARRGREPVPHSTSFVASMPDDRMGGPYAQAQRLPMFTATQPIARPPVSAPYADEAEDNTLRQLLAGQQQLLQLLQKQSRESKTNAEQFQQALHSAIEGIHNAIHGAVEDMKHATSMQDPLQGDARGRPGFVTNEQLDAALGKLRVEFDKKILAQNAKNVQLREQHVQLRESYLAETASPERKRKYRSSTRSQAIFDCDNSADEDYEVGSRAKKHRSRSKATDKKANKRKSEVSNEGASPGQYNRRNSMGRFVPKSENAINDPKPVKPHTGIVESDGPDHGAAEQDVEDHEAEVESGDDDAEMHTFTTNITQAAEAKKASQGSKSQIGRTTVQSKVPAKGPAKQGGHAEAEAPKDWRALANQESEYDDDDDDEDYNAEGGDNLSKHSEIHHYY